ncbi:hypothetical protein ACZ87_00820, partial [Candidatus Erwinia dacicola]
ALKLPFLPWGGQIYIGSDKVYENIGANPKYHSKKLVLSYFLQLVLNLNFLA